MSKEGLAWHLIHTHEYGHNTIMSSLETLSDEEIWHYLNGLHIIDHIEPQLHRELPEHTQKHLIEEQEYWKDV